MRNLIRGGLLLVAGAAFLSVLPDVADACGCLRRHRCHLHRRCCRVCAQPPQACRCTTFQPVLETHYTEQRFITYRTVPEVHYRKEQFMTKVPVTAYENVTVDEGSFQKVWVPKLVNKQVPRTVLQDQLQERTVPYQVNRQVPQISSRLVPQQTVRYVPRQTRCVVNPPLGWTQPIAPPTVPILTRVRSAPFVAVPTPDPRFRSASGVPYTGLSGPPATATSNMFVPAPSAAAVWSARQAGLGR